MWHHLHFTYEETEAQRDCITHPRSHHLYVAELITEPSLFSSRGHTLSVSSLLFPEEGHLPLSGTSLSPHCLPHPIWTINHPCPAAYTQEFSLSGIQERSQGQFTQIKDSAPLRTELGPGSRVQKAMRCPESESQRFKSTQLGGISVLTGYICKLRFRMGQGLVQGCLTYQSEGQNLRTSSGSSPLSL